MNKKHVLAIAVGALAIAVAGTAVAADATITFKGAVDATTCTVTGGTGTDAAVGNFTVTLVPVALAELQAVGDVSRPTPFNIELTGPACTNDKKVQTKINISNPNINANGNLKNTAAAADAAKNVELQLLNKSGVPINLKSTPLVADATITKNKAILEHKVQYVATGPATAGAVESTLTYSIQYD